MILKLGGFPLLSMENRSFELVNCQLWIEFYLAYCQDVVFNFSCCYIIMETPNIEPLWIIHSSLPLILRDVILIPSVQSENWESVTCSQHSGKVKNSRTTLRVEFMFVQNVIMSCFPGNTTHFLQSAAKMFFFAVRPSILTSLPGLLLPRHIIQIQSVNMKKNQEL